MSDLPAALLDRLGAVRSVGVITGAGISAESGISTYRGRGGLYDDPDEGDRTVEALSGPTLRRDPDRTWRTLAGLALQAGAARPNAAHRALAAIERRVERFVLLTQNVDGLHRAAGCRNTIEIHGHVFDMLCTGCGRRGRLDPAILPGLTAAPRCERCRAVIRPDVVLFEELLPADRLARIRDEFHVGMPDLVVVAGTTALFPYVAAPVHAARLHGRLTVEINPEPTDLSDAVEFVVRDTAGRALAALASALGATVEP